MEDHPNHHPPRWAQRLLHGYCPEEVMEEIEGDLEEAFYHRLEKEGPALARRQYCIDVLRFFNPLTFRKARRIRAQSITFPVNHPAMWNNYLKIALRNIRKQKLFSLINILGLAVGLAFVILVFLFVQHELSYDRFHSNAENIYRVEEVQYQQSGLEDKPSLFKAEQEGIVKYGYLPLPTGPVMQEEIPEVLRFSRFTPTEAVVSRGEQIFSEKIHLVDSTFFRLFDFELLAGNPEEVLDEKNRLVISPGIARKYFGYENPLGRELQVVTYTDTLACTVSGIVEPPPANSSLQFDMLLNIRHKPGYEKSITQWGSFNTGLFVELAPGSSLAAVEKKLQAFAREYMADTYTFLKDRFKLSEEDKIFELNLSPLPDIHLDPSVTWKGSAGNPMNIFILSGLGLIILLTACLNYISLALTSASGRTREVGIRKVLGSTRWQLSLQFWVEAQLLVLISLLLALGLAAWFLPVFNAFVQRNLAFDLGQQAGLALALLGIMIITGLLAGGYPAGIISRIRAAEVLKGKTYRYKPGLTQGIVVLQNALSVFLIISALIMYRQMDFINSKDLGYDTDQVLVLDLKTSAGENSELLLERMRNSLEGRNGIREIAAANVSFNQGANIRGFGYEGEVQSAYYYRVSQNYLSTLGIELLEGRNFSTAKGMDKEGAIIINEALAEQLGMENPIGQRLPWGEGKALTIIGLVKDYHVESLNQPVQPVMLTMDDAEGGLAALLVKISGREIAPAIEAVQSTWKAAAPGRPFEYTFLDEDVAAQYESYQRWMNIIWASTLFAIFIACLGLFGLSGIFAVNRRKEVSIRKVFGARTANILLLLNKNLFKLAFLSLLIATPVAWWSMRQWLANFEYKAEMGWGPFVIAGAISLCLAVATVSYHALRTALANPVEALREE